MCRDNDDLETVNLLELECFRVRSAGHAGQIVVEPKVVLKRNGGDRLVFLLDRNAFLGFYRPDAIRRTSGGPAWFDP